MNEKRFTINSFAQSKIDNKKISMLTAYDFAMARLLDEAGVDCLLVGDSLGMVMLGYENTLKVTMDDMVHHCKAVARGAKHAMVVGDMPFLSYYTSIEEGVKNAGRLIQQGGVHAVKLEGGSHVIEMVKAITRAQIPVMGHLGLKPQSVNMYGGYTVQGRDKEKAEQIISDAILLEESGVFSIVLECVPAKLAKQITEKLSIPTIGIGAGKYCDGQVLVAQDMMGIYTEFNQKFVKRYAEIGSSIIDAVTAFKADIENGLFPLDEHSFKG